MLKVKLTEQFIEKPTHRQWCHGLVNSQTNQLAYSEFLPIDELLYLYTKPNPSPNQGIL